MTSSLVGSEMCIRDSLDFVLASPSLCWVSIRSGLYLKVEFLWDQTLAVSYTHLTLPTICSV
eukprot:9585998-Prorocentrum_lima.AAC.1